jgi:hypothetical protein
MTLMNGLLKRNFNQQPGLRRCLENLTDLTNSTSSEPHEHTRCRIHLPVAALDIPRDDLAELEQGKKMKLTETGKMFDYFLFSFHVVK